MKLHGIINIKDKTLSFIASFNMSPTDSPRYSLATLHPPPTMQLFREVFL